MQDGNDTEYDMNVFQTVRKLTSNTEFLLVIVKIAILWVPNECFK